MSDRLQKQVAEIEAIIETTGLSAEELADRAALRPETMRKYLKGYAEASDVVMRSFRHIAQLALIARGAQGKDAALHLRDYGGPFWGATDEAPIVSSAQAGDAHAYLERGGDIKRIKTSCKDPHCYVLEVEGDSMEPKYFKGDLLVVSPSREPINGDLVVAKVKKSEEVMFKIYHASGRANDRVYLTSYNPAYPPFDFSRMELQFIHPVHSVVRQLRKDL